jgi:hypothetical protein
VNVQALVSMPPNLRSRQQRWNYPFLRFVALRHPRVRLQNLEVLDGTTHRSVSEVALNGLLADRALPRANYDDAEGRSQLTARQMSSSLDRLLGVGQALVLVDAGLSKASRESVRYGGPDLDGLMAKRDYSRSETRVVRMDVCVVVQREIPAGAWETFQSEQIAPYCKLRVVKLPKI